VRELPDWGEEPTLREGITPACAGITSCAGCMQKCVQDHPRVCGNYWLPNTIFFGRSGSPPRVRELLTLDGVMVKAAGITPACAGITNLPSLLEAMNEDHPRVCGNYSRTRLKGASALGSPPRVRELRCCRAVRVNGSRITPACAGITIMHFLPVIFNQDHPRVCGNYNLYFMLNLS